MLILNKYSNMGNQVEAQTLLNDAIKSFKIDSNNQCWHVRLSELLLLTHAHCSLHIDHGPKPWHLRAPVHPIDTLIPMSLQLERTVGIDFTMFHAYFGYSQCTSHVWYAHLVSLLMLPPRWRQYTRYWLTSEGNVTTISLNYRFKSAIYLELWILCLEIFFMIFNIFKIAHDCTFVRNATTEDTFVL